MINTDQTHSYFSLSIDVLPRILIYVADILLTEKVCRAWKNMTHQHVAPAILESLENDLGKDQCNHIYCSNSEELTSIEKLKMLFQNLKQRCKDFNIPFKIDNSLTLMKYRELEQKIKTEENLKQPLNPDYYWTAPSLREPTYNLGYHAGGLLLGDNHPNSSWRWRGLQQDNKQ